MASQIPATVAIALVKEVIHETEDLKAENQSLKAENQFYKAENNSIRLAYQELQHDSAQRDAIIDQQAKFLQSTGFGTVSNGDPGMPSFIEGQLGSPTQNTVTLVEAPQLQGMAPNALEETNRGPTRMQNKKRKAATDSDRPTQKHQKRFSAAGSV
jgi:hypothetical protein